MQNCTFSFSFSSQLEHISMLSVRAISYQIPHPHLPLAAKKLPNVLLFYNKYMRMIASVPLQFSKVLTICTAATNNAKHTNWKLGTSELLHQNYRTPRDTISSVHNGGHVYKLIFTSNFQDTCNMKLSGQQSHSVYSVWDVAWFSFTIISAPNYS